MNYKITVSFESENDIDNIVSYLVNKLKSRTAANNFLLNIETVFRNLSEHPKIFSLCNDQHLQNFAYRRAVIDKYIVVFRIFEDEVFVDRVFHGSQDYARYL